MKRSVVAIFMFSGLFTLPALALAAKIEGTPGDDVLVGNVDKKDIIKAGAGDDRIMLLGHAGWDEIYCGSGADTLDLSEMAIGERTGARLDLKTAPNSHVYGCENIIGTDQAIGDGLFGDDKANRLTGGAGGDMLIGGPGADTFVYLLPTDSTADAPDLIVDFNPAEGDNIELSGLAGASELKKGSLHYIGKAAFSGVAGQVRYERGRSGRLEIDLDGDHKADLSIAFGSGRVKAKWIQKLRVRIPATIPGSAITLK